MIVLYFNTADHSLCPVAYQQTALVSFNLHVLSLNLSFNYLNQTLTMELVDQKVLLCLVFRKIILYMSFRKAPTHN